MLKTLHNEYAHCTVLHGSAINVVRYRPIDDSASQCPIYVIVQMGRGRQRSVLVYGDTMDAVLRRHAAQMLARIAS
jgi:hypothetical protein